MGILEYPVANESCGFDLRSKEVEKPDHYVNGRKYEPRKVIKDWDLNWNLANVVKYASRAGRKGSKDDAIKDLMKIKQYAEFEIEDILNEKEDEE